MCSCVKTMDEALAKENTKLSQAWVFGDLHMRLMMATTKVDTSKRGKPKTALAGPSCTWCGKKP